MGEYQGNTRLPTFDAETYQMARRAWDTGSFGPDWHEVRSISWERGYPFPPDGDPDDDDEHQTQRYIIWRALKDWPIETIGFARESWSWHEVVERIFASRAKLREESLHRDELAAEDRAEWLTHRESVTAIKRILDRIGDS